MEALIVAAMNKIRDLAKDRSDLKSVQIVIPVSGEIRISVEFHVNKKSDQQ